METFFVIGEQITTYPHTYDHVAGDVERSNAVAVENRHRVEAGARHIDCVYSSGKLTERLWMPGGDRVV